MHNTFTIKYLDSNFQLTQTLAPTLAVYIYISVASLRESELAQYDHMSRQRGDFFVYLFANVSQDK